MSRHKHVLNAYNHCRLPGKDAVLTHTPSVDLSVFRSLCKWCFLWESWLLPLPRQYGTPSFFPPKYSDILKFSLIPLFQYLLNNLSLPLDFSFPLVFFFFLISEVTSTQYIKFHVMEIAATGKCLF
jgi:hypothetical protein